MAKMSDESKKSIQQHLIKMEECIGHRQRLGGLTPIIGYPLIVGFSLFLVPLYLYMIIFSRLYFWIRNQKQMDHRKFYHYDRHNVSHLTLVDKIWCEYCEWANGTLEWTLAFTNEIERRYCPIQNKHPNCPKLKTWRQKFLKHDHSADDLGKYYQETYPKDIPE
jgi:hypothetical protein